MARRKSDNDDQGLLFGEPAPAHVQQEPPEPAPERDKGAEVAAPEAQRMFVEASPAPRPSTINGRPIANAYESALVADVDRQAAKAHVPPGWSRQSWSRELRRMAESCGEAKPEAAAAYMRWAAAVDRA